MNRILSFLCLVSLLVFQMSCNKGIMDLESSEGELKTRATEQKVKDLIQQARSGDAEAYKSLAICYRDGKGVEKSYLNMVCLYSNYCKKTGGVVENVVEILGETDPFRLLLEIVNSSLSDEDVVKRMEYIQKYAREEMKAIKAFGNLSVVENSENALNEIRDAESMGSELAALFQVMYYEEANRIEDYEQNLIRLSGKYPFLNLKLGELFEEKYKESNDSADIQKAMDYYYEADVYGMLTPQYANRLIKIYKQYGEQGMMTCDNYEIERLKQVANIKD